MKLKHIVLAVLAFPLVATAQPANTDTVISFGTEVEKEVAHDLLQVTLFTQTENADLQQASKEVNEKINRALALVKTQPVVQVKDNTRSTYVRYNPSGKQNGWVARGQLVLQSTDNDILSKMINELSGILAIEYVNSSVSAATLSNLEDEMMQTALKQVERKAQLIQQSLQAKSYKILDLTINSPREDGHFAPRAYAMAKSKSFDEDGDMQLGNGKSNVKTRIDARIELVKE
ncbi:SIMPL domain-containing protein [Caviibacterium pharyngocola]|uniref:SIMPL domain-containing protein n=1 Tax=Caviibacterium pharyngocola TaxID=28159 RepID=A0A2M8RTW9_9PAST|nr:SIMPL domain-containing protein [Caviibacterium pharyngocola]PJG82335.1 hypothetical protein CVP04_09490 [Caviibacterium pharyngocola]